MTFTAIDFETANQTRTSACQIGIVVVTDGKITKKFSSFIKPPEPSYFLKKFTDEIHGITKEMVANAPTFDILWKDISADILNTPLLVAHNTQFDMSVLRETLEYYNIKENLPADYCTLKASRRHLPHLENHKLSTVSNHFNIELNHHEALSDAVAASKIAIEFGMK